MDLQEMRRIPLTNLTVTIQTLHAELRSLRFQSANGQLKHVRKMRVLRKEIAQAMTILRERTLV